MVSIYATLSLGELAELLFTSVHVETPNLDYKPPVPGCSHYRTTDEMITPYCPQCGKKNEVVVCPKNVTRIDYKDNRTGLIIDNRPVQELIEEMHRTKSIQIPGLKNPVPISSSRIPSLQLGYDECKYYHEPGGFKIDSESTVHLICFQFEEFGYITSKVIENAVRMTKIFEAIGWQLQIGVLPRHSHQKIDNGSR